MGVGAFVARPDLFAQEATLTPAQTIGPYYPDKLPLDLDNDLIRINDNMSTALGEISWVSGRVMDRSGAPIRGALVEIWQADNNGAYIHSRSPSSNRDTGFQGYGKFVTGSTGEYLFRTVKPGLYPGRTRHVHYQITMPGSSSQKLVTQLYVQGDALNANDGVLNGIRDTAQRNSVIVPWTPIPGSLIGELAAKFDIVMGYTPADPIAGKPSILTENGIVNGAGYQPGITPGAWLSIFGDNLASTSRPWNPQSEIASGKLPTSLDGVSVTINGKASPIYYISPNQINIQAPSDDTTGPVQVVVTNSNGTSNAVTATIQTILPGFFLTSGYYVAAARPDGSLVGPTSPAKPGETITLYGTGFGPTSPRVNAGEVFEGAAPLSNAVTLRIGTAIADVRFAGLSAAGLYQFNLVVPNLPDGDQDVFATIAGVRTQSLARLLIQR